MSEIPKPDNCGTRWRRWGLIKSGQYKEVQCPCCRTRFTTFEMTKDMRFCDICEKLSPAERDDPVSAPILQRLELYMYDLQNQVEALQEDTKNLESTIHKQEFQIKVSAIDSLSKRISHHLYLNDKHRRKRIKCNESDKDFVSLDCNEKLERELG